MKEESLFIPVEVAKKIAFACQLRKMFNDNAHKDDVLMNELDELPCRDYMYEPFTLEYSEEQQCFHYNRGDHPKNSFSFITVKENCHPEFVFKIKKKINFNQHVSLEQVKQIIKDIENEC